MIFSQNCRIGSPNLDLGYYIFTTGKPEVRKKWKELLDCYFEQFKDSVLKLKMDFPFQFEVRFCMILNIQKFSNSILIILILILGFRRGFQTKGKTRIFPRVNAGNWL